MAPKRKGASANQCGAHLDLSRVRVVQLVKEGALPRNADDSFDLDACRIAYIHYLRSEDRRGAKSATASRVQEARAKEIELRTAREEGRLVPMDDVNAAIADILGTYRSELNGVPAASSRDLAVRGEIEKQLNDAIDRCRQRFEKVSDDLRAGREVSLEGEETDA
jgi:phage terminase Nu1 subunit (DNA packaging protein)